DHEDPEKRRHDEHERKDRHLREGVRAPVEDLGHPPTYPSPVGWWRKPRAIRFPRVTAATPSSWTSSQAPANTLRGRLHKSTFAFRDTVAPGFGTGLPSTDSTMRAVSIISVGFTLGFVGCGGDFTSGSGAGGAGMSSSSSSNTGGAAGNGGVGTSG